MKSARRLAALVLALAAGVAYASQAVPDFQGPEREQFLLKAKIASVKSLSEGVTGAKKVTLELNGATHAAVFKAIDESKPGATKLADGSLDIGYQDSWQTEIAAYQIDRIIGLGLVPATVERRLETTVGSYQWWVDSMMTEATRIEKKISPPDVEVWNREMFRVRLFDQLISNVDRHLKNILITKEFEVRLIDHSRSFRPNRQLAKPEDLTRFSKSLLEGIQRLEKNDLKKRLGRYLQDAQIERLLQRRDAILELAKKRVAEKGEAAVIYP